MEPKLKGVSYPFRFTGRGGVATSEADFMSSEHIKEGIIQRLMTRKGERRMSPDFYSDLYDIPYENFNSSMITLIKDRVRSNLNANNPFIEVENVMVEQVYLEDKDDYGLAIGIDYEVIRSKLKDHVDVVFSKAGD